MYRLAAVTCVLLLAACAAPEATISDTAVPAPAEAVSPVPAEPGQIEFAEAPAPPQQAVPVQANAPVVVCQLERRTGTNRKVRVCRERTSAADAAEAQDVFNSLRRQQIDLDQ